MPPSDDDDDEEEEEEEEEGSKDMPRRNAVGRRAGTDGAVAVAVDQGLVRRRRRRRIRVVVVESVIIEGRGYMVSGDASGGIAGGGGGEKNGGTQTRNSERPVTVFGVASYSLATITLIRKNDGLLEGTGSFLKHFLMMANWRYHYVFPSFFFLSAGF